MGIFSRNKTPSPPQAKALVGSGRRLSSAFPPIKAIAFAQQLMDSYAPRQYQTLPHMVPAGFTWHGPAELLPREVYVAEIAQAAHPGDYLIISFTAHGSGTEIGVFPPGVGDDRLTIPFVGNLKMLDNSLGSTGTIPGDQLELSAPPVAPDLVGRTLEMAGFPLTDDNLTLAAGQFFMMTQIKANQFLDSIGGPNAVARCEDWQARARFGPTLVEPMVMVLCDLAARVGMDVLPWIQDIPIRIQSVMIEAAASPTSFWAEAQRG